MDGWITIGTELATDKFDKQILDLENKMKQEEKKKLNIEGEIKTNEDKLRIQAIAYKEVNQLAEEYEQKIAQINNELSQIPTDVKGLPITDESKWSELKNDISAYYGEAAKIYNEMVQIDNESIKIITNIETLNNKHESINQKLEEYRNKISSIGYQKQQEELGKVKQSMSGIGNSVGGIIKSVGRWVVAIIGIRSIYSGIRNAVSTLTQYNDELAGKIEAIKLALASALAPVVEFIVNLITKAVALLGYVLKILFGIDIFAKASAMSMKKATGSAKELKKQLAGFDEMNVLNEDGTTGIAGGINNALNALKDMNEIGEGVFNKIKNWLFGFTWEGFADAIAEQLIAMKTIFEPVFNWFSKQFEPIKKMFIELYKELEPILEPMKKYWKEMVQQLLEELEPLKPYWDDLVNHYLKPLWDDFVDYIKPNVVDPLLDYFRPIGREIHNFLVPYVNKVIDWINRAFGVLGVNLKYWEYETEETSNNVTDSIGQAMENSENASNSMKNSVLNNFGEINTGINELSNETIEINTDTTQIDNVQGGLDRLLNTLFEIISKPWTIVTTFTTNLSNTFSNLFAGIRQRFSSIGINLPFMATGGIVNMPNKGTLVGGAMVGESGREGVIPLTDQQAMSELGREIGRNVVVNLTNITTMNGRVLNRELKQVGNEQDFAYNT